MEGDVGEACFHLALASIALEHGEARLEYVRTLVLLGWLQDVDGRPWQAVATLSKAVSSVEFEQLPGGIRTKALYAYARALWSLGEYDDSLVRGEQAYRTAEHDSERGRAALAIAQAAVCLGLPLRATEAFDQAIDLDPSLRVSAYAIRAYLHNLAGRHREAIQEAEEGLLAAGHGPLETADTYGRAAESCALLVELGTAKAFLGAADAREVILEARRRLPAGGPGGVDLERARTSRALAVVLARCGEHDAASALLAEASKVFSRRGAQSEHALTFSALSFIAKKEAEKT